PSTTSTAHPPCTGVESSHDNSPRPKREFSSPQQRDAPTPLGASFVSRATCGRADVRGMVLACFLIESLRKEVTTDALDDHPYPADPLGPRRSPRPRPVDSHPLGHRAHRAARAADLRSQSRSLTEAH